MTRIKDFSLASLILVRAFSLDIEVYFCSRFSSSPLHIWLYSIVSVSSDWGKNILCTTVHFLTMQYVTISYENVFVYICGR